MSNHNNQQRRVARRFKRTQLVTQHHQRGHWVITFSLALLLGLLLVAACVAVIEHYKQRQVTAPSTRIDWEQVPVYPPTVFCDLRTTRSGCITENQRALRRESKRVYAALAFERVR